MIPRSLLFVPADSEKKLAKALTIAADALILDLEDSVAAPNRAAARHKVCACLKHGAPMQLYVRVNAPGSVDLLHDLDAIVPAAPAALVVPKVETIEDLIQLDRLIAEREVQAGLTRGQIKLLPVATETPRAVLNLLAYQKAPPRLMALTWGAEDLAAALGASTNRGLGGEFLFTYQVVRSLALIAAKAAQVGAIETLYADFRDEVGLERSARNAAMEGFDGMLAIHPGQVAVINEAFSPSEPEIAHAQRVVAAFAHGEGVAALDGKMLDMPHLKQAQAILVRAERLSSLRP